MNTMDERRKKILCAIIQSHIDLNIPIGSYFITQKFPLDLSPATIRNAMAKLEELGYITQPHTSAGRIPTEKGYKFYVNTLLEGQALPVNSELSYELSAEAMINDKDNNKIIKQAAETLSLYSHYLAIAIPPKTEDMTLKHIKFIKYEDKKVLAVFVSEEGTINNKIIGMDKIYTQKQLDRASNYINSKFHGLTIKNVREKITDQLYSDKIVCDQIIANLVALFREIIMDDSTKLAFNGFSGASNLPDFASMKQIKEILRAIEDKQFMLKLLNHVSSAQGTQVFIGMEDIIPSLKELSMVISTYKDRKYLSGAIGIIGPTRMNYKKLIPFVDHTAKVLTRILSVT
jgi:heat-inducible transcriptional repressor